MIRKMNPNDFDKVLEISKLVIDNHLTIEELNRYQSDNNYLLLVDDTVSSYLIGIIEMDEFEIIEVATSVDKRRMGFATSLIESITTFENNIKVILLEVRTKNIPARNLYDKLGFVFYRERKNYYKDDDCLCLKKVII